MRYPLNTMGKPIPVQSPRANHLPKGGDALSAPKKVQSWHDSVIKRPRSKRSVLWGTWRGKHAKPSTVRTIYKAKPTFDDPATH